jgi:TetR/AcrR family transcriptional regulator, mexJK operon transcriptional repressor
MYRTVWFIVNRHESNRMSLNPSNRRDRKRAAIIAAAKDLFFREGYAGASMAQITARVGGSKATLYSHFRSKEELLVAVVQDMIVPSHMLLEGGPCPSADFRFWLHWLGCRTVRRLTSYEFLSIQRLATAEALRFPEIGRIYYEAGASPFYDFIARFFTDAMEGGVLRRSDPRVAAELFIEMCAGWLMRRALWNIGPEPTEADIESNVQAAVGVFMDGYEPQAANPE